MQYRHLQRVKHGRAGGHRGVAHVGVPLAAGAFHADLLALVVEDIGKLVDIRRSVDAKDLRIVVLLDRAKAGGERNLLVSGQVLVPEEDDAVLIERLLDLVECRIIDRLRNVDATDLCAAGAARWNNLDWHYLVRAFGVCLSVETCWARR